MRDLIRLNRRPTAAQAGDRGQALVEFALVLIPFVILLMGVIDLGRGIYTMNGTSEAARDINRATIVHLTDGSGNLGYSPETTARIETQRDLVPGLEIDPSTDIVCVDADDQVLDFGDCTRGVDFIRVEVSAPFSPITPLVSAFGSHEFESTSRMQIP
jgi:TadE-like protein